jgi:hypothetical protein
VAEKERKIMGELYMRTTMDNDVDVREARV